MKKTVCPPSLLAVQDLLERHPDERSALLAHEIQRHERERLLCASTRQLIHLHLWDMAKTLIVTGVIVFVLLITVSQLRSLGTWVLEMEQSLQQSAIMKAMDINITPYLPSKSTITFLSRLPVLSWHQAALFALLCMTVILVVQLVMAIANWRKTSFLKDAVEELDEDIAILKRWQREA